MQNKVSLFNLALEFTGSRGSPIAAVDERTIEAETCRRWYDVMRDFIFRAAFWDSLKAFATLALLSQSSGSEGWREGDPEPGYKYAYATPSDMVYPRYLESYQIFSLGVQNGIRALYCNEEEPVLIYTRVEENIDIWDSNLYLAVASALGSQIALPIHGNQNEAGFAAQKANDLIGEARAQEANKIEENIDVIPEWIAAGGYDGGSFSRNYYQYPYGEFITVAGVGNAIRNQNR